MDFPVNVLLLLICQILTTPQNQFFISQKRSRWSTPFVNLRNLILLYNLSTAINGLFVLLGCYTIEISCSINTSFRCRTTQVFCFTIYPQKTAVDYYATKGVRGRFVCLSLLDVRCLKRYPKRLFLYRLTHFTKMMNITWAFSKRTLNQAFCIEGSGTSKKSLLCF